MSRKHSKRRTRFGAHKTKGAKRLHSYGLSRGGVRL